MVQILQIGITYVIYMWLIGNYLKFYAFIITVNPAIMSKTKYL